jgi:hypothetical protein
LEEYNPYDESEAYSSHDEDGFCDSDFYDTDDEVEEANQSDDIMRVLEGDW